MSHYFVGIPIRGQQRDRLEKWSQQIKSFFDYKVWVHPNDFHITLAFLGVWETSSIEELKGSLENLQSLPSFHIEVGELGTFGSTLAPRVLYANVKKNDTLEKLHHQVHEQIEFQKENRPYLPHITLAKKWKSEQKLDKPFSGKDYIKHAPYEKMKVDRICLFEIHPERAQKYECIKSIDLKGEEDFGPIN